MNVSERGTLKVRDRKMQDQKCGVKNAELKMQDWKMHDLEKMPDLEYK